MEQYEIRVIKECEPLIIDAKNENEAKAIIQNKLKYDSSKDESNNLIKFNDPQILIRNSNQGWLKDFIYDNF